MISQSLRSLISPVKLSFVLISADCSAVISPASTKLAWLISTKMCIRDSYSSGASQDNSQTILEDAGKIDLSSYDLIYINGHLSKDMADQAAQSQVPCVVNCDRAINVTFKESFAAYIKGEYEDGSYVNYQVYFYKNLFASTTRCV